MSGAEIAAIWYQESASRFAESARYVRSQDLKRWACALQQRSADQYAAARTILGIVEHPFELPEIVRPVTYLPAN